MKDHPMLLMRDPPPEFDVTRPALTPAERALIVDALEGIAKTITESAAQAPEPARAGGEDHSVTTPDAADFKAGDRIMVLDCQTLRREPHTFHKENEVLFSACPLGANPILDMYCYLRERYLPRRPTDAELLDHWGEK